MNLSAMPKAFLNQHSWYESSLSQVTPINNNFKSVSSKIIYTYNNVINVGRKFRVGGKSVKYLGEDRNFMERERLLILFSVYNFWLDSNSTT
jgi:hypothetical protein